MAWERTRTDAVEKLFPSRECERSNDPPARRNQSEL